MSSLNGFLPRDVNMRTVLEERRLSSSSEPYEEWAEGTQCLSYPRGPAFSGLRGVIRPGVDASLACSIRRLFLSNLDPMMLSERVRDPMAKSEVLQAQDMSQMRTS